MKTFRFMGLSWRVNFHNREIQTLGFVQAMLAPAVCYMLLTGYQMPEVDSVDQFHKEFQSLLSLYQSFFLSTIFCLTGLFPFLVQKSEKENNVLYQYHFLPIRYWQIFLIRWVNTLLFLLFYVVLSQALGLLISLAYFSENMFYSFSYFFEAFSTVTGLYLSTLFGYFSLLVLASFMVDNLLIGFSIGLFSYFLHFLDAAWFLPFSYPFARFNQYQVSQLYPNSSYALETLYYPEAGSILLGVIFLYLGLAHTRNFISNSGASTLKFFSQS